MAIVPAVLLGLVVYFFRDPPRRVPAEAGLIVSPADGKIAEITRLEHDEFIGGPAVRIGIFLSIFNVHMNRAPVESRVIALRYSPGEFLNALKPESAWRNENTWIGLEEESPPHRRMIVRQISGQFARRIVCDLRPGEVVPRGQKFGMIKLGSRTELILPDTEDLKIEVEVGQKVKAGTTVMANGNFERLGPKSKLTIMRPIRTIAVFPTLFTLGNLVCGFFAIVVAARVEKPAMPSCRRTFYWTSTNVMISGWLIFLAMIFDGLDGYVARLVRTPPAISARSWTACATWSPSAWRRAFCW